MYKDKFRLSLHDVCVKRGADVASDHHLLVAMLKLKLKRNGKGERSQHKRYDRTILIKDITKLLKFKTALSNKLMILVELLKDGRID